jgi:hypothetical protein
MLILKMFQAPNILLNVEVIEAKDLRPKDANGKSYLILQTCVLNSVYHFVTSNKSLYRKVRKETNYIFLLTDINRIKPHNVHSNYF